LLLCGVLAVAAAACGKRGAPLAPFSNLPAAVTAVTAKRVGTQVVFQFTVPTRNVDGRQPANLDRVELYMSATRLPQAAEFLRRGALVGSVTVRRPPPEGGQAASEGQDPASVEQGAVAMIVEQPGASAPPSAPVAAARKTAVRASPELFDEGGGPLLSPRRSTPTTRFYVLAGVNRNGRAGTVSQIIQMPRIDAPPAPSDVRVTYTETGLRVSWADPLVPLRHPIQSPTLEPGTLASRSVVAFAASAGYRVYQVPADTDAAAAGGPGIMPAPLNAAPLTAAMFEEPTVEFGVERCFIVRTEETVGGVVVESAASSVACVTPSDTFPPAPPRSVAAVASEGAISLIWEPNNESDLNGYLVLRGEAPGEKLQALTTAPITETTYRDTTTQRGVEYVYAVVAVDKANNVSAQSNRAEDRAR
jgi:hypothetical protein